MKVIVKHKEGEVEQIVYKSVKGIKVIKVNKKTLL